MSDATRKKQGESIKLPPELQQALRREIAPYLARGEKPPTRGDLLTLAWNAYRSSGGSEVVQEAPREEEGREVIARMQELLAAIQEAVRQYSDAHPQTVPPAVAPVLGQCAEILRSGNAKIIQHVRQQVEMAYQSAFGDKASAGQGRTKHPLQKSMRP